MATLTPNVIYFKPVTTPTTNIVSNTDITFQGFYFLLDPSVVFSSQTTNNVGLVYIKDDFSAFLYYDILDAAWYVDEIGSIQYLCAYNVFPEDNDYAMTGTITIPVSATSPIGTYLNTSNPIFNYVAVPVLQSPNPLLVRPFSLTLANLLMIRDDYQCQLKKCLTCNKCKTKKSCCEPQDCCDTRMIVSNCALISEIATVIDDLNACERLRFIS